MPAGQTIILRGESQRKFAKEFIDKAPQNAIVNIRESNRSNEQNSKLWAMLSDVSRAKPDGRKYTADMWKAVFMNATGYQIQFIIGLEGEPFPNGFSSSRLTVNQMADLITFIYQYGDKHNVIWTEHPPQSGV